MKDKTLDIRLIAELKKIIDSSERIAIISHTAPDGDSIASSLGLKMLLVAYGKKRIDVVVPDAYPEYLSQLIGANEILVHEEQAKETETILEEADLIFCLDFNTLSRVANLEEALRRSNAKRVLIDHHLFPADDFVLRISYPDYSATSELLCQIAIALEIEHLISKEIATAFLTGIFTDTGVLYYNASDPGLYRLVALLMEKGADKDEIIKQTFQSNSEGRVRFQGFAIYDKMQMIPEIKSAIVTMSEKEMQHFNLQPGDTDGIANMPLEIKDVQASVFLRENKGFVKLSFRSVGDFPVNKLAEQYFGGGGHKNAAGGEWYGSLSEAKDRLQEALKHFNPCNYKESTNL